MTGIPGSFRSALLRGGFPLGPAGFGGAADGSATGGAHAAPLRGFAAGRCGFGGAHDGGEFLVQGGDLLFENNGALESVSEK